MALLARLVHEMLTAPTPRRAAGRGRRIAARGQPPSRAEAVNVREIRRAYDRAVKLPAALVEELARVDDAGPARLAGGAAEERLPRLRAVARKDRRPQARRRPRRSATRSRPTTRCSTSTSRAPRRAEITAIFAELRGELVPLVGAIAASRQEAAHATS